MRTTFSEMHLFNDKFERQDTSFILNGKEWGAMGITGERERERERCGVMVKMGCGVGHKLALWSSINQGLEIDFIKMKIKLIQKKFYYTKCIQYNININNSCDCS
jgi:hypothetical protein